MRQSLKIRWILLSSLWLWYIVLFNSHALTFLCRNDDETSSLSFALNEYRESILPTLNRRSSNRTFVAAHHDTTTTNNNKTLQVQAFIISLQSAKAQKCIQANRYTGIPSWTHFPATNGRDQAVLDEWFALTKTKLLKTKDFQKGFKDGYEHPHSVGCFLSHWRLLQLTLASYQTLLLPMLMPQMTHVATRPDALILLEDDAVCVDNLYQYLQDVIPKLPRDWDLFMIGGKPFSYLSKRFSISKRRIIANRSHPELFHELACQGYFGNSSTGPFAPNGSRRINPQHDAYWKIEYMTNTHAYVVNPHRLEKVVHLLNTAHDNNLTGIVPVDIVYAEAMRAGKLNAYMPTQEYCHQQEKKQSTNNTTTTATTTSTTTTPAQRLLPLHHPLSPWMGYYHHEKWHSLFHLPYEWGPIYYTDCPARDQGIF
jgi:GR25 family glycosyltransferase involved in LPS biosynthesis